jgi:hypothetical protein
VEMRKKVLGGKLVLLVKRVEVCGRRGLGIEYVELKVVAGLRG